MKQSLLFILSILCLPICGKAQSNLIIQDSIPLDTMLQDFFSNGCLTFSNITYTGTLNSLAYFEGANTDLNLGAGIFISTGDVNTAPGPNAASGTSENHGTAGDSDLNNLIPPFTTFDAAILEFDIVPNLDTLHFLYVFSSEEYPEYVCSSFNDVFAFFIQGPGYPNPTNIAMVPDTNDPSGNTYTNLPVAINSVNSGIPSGSPANCADPYGSLAYSQYYVDNSTGQHLEFDGFTVALPAKATVVPGQSYHVKIAVADVGDNVFDSGVFLSSESLCGDSLVTPPAKYSFIVNGNELSVQNNSRYATSYLWDYGDNTMSTSKSPAPHVYSADGYYTVTLITQNFCCSDTISQTITIGNPTSNSSVSLKPITVSPNPFNSQLSITGLEDIPHQLEVFNLLGEQLLLLESAGQGQVDLSVLSSGTYILQIRDSQEVLHRQVILKHSK